MLKSQLITPMIFKAMHELMQHKTVFMFALVMFLGCSKGTTSQNSAPPTVTPAVKKYQQAKLLVQNEPKGNTGVYHQNLKVSSQPLLNGTPANGSHSFELTNTANFKGKTPTCVADQTALLINHTTIYKGDWHFPPSAKVSIVADGETFRPVKVIQKELELEDGEYWESLIIEPKCEMYAKLGKAKAVEIRIGEASIALSPDEIADYRRFTEAIGFK